MDVEEFLRYGYLIIDSRDNTFILRQLPTLKKYRVQIIPNWKDSTNFEVLVSNGKGACYRFYINLRDLVKAIPQYGQDIPYLFYGFNSEFNKHLFTISLKEIQIISFVGRVIIRFGNSDSEDDTIDFGASCIGKDLNILWHNIKINGVSVFENGFNKPWLINDLYYSSSEQGYIIEFSGDLDYDIFISLDGSIYMFNRYNKSIFRYVTKLEPSSYVLHELLALGIGV